MGFIYRDRENAKARYPIREQCRNLEDAIRLYKARYGDYPSETNMLVVIANDDVCRKLIRVPNLSDPWGTPYRARILNDRPVVDSAGEDRKFDTADDIHGF